MKTDHQSLPIPLRPLPAAWKNEVEVKLNGDEKILAHLELDLDSTLRFVPGLIVVTDRRLLANPPGTDAWREWNYDQGLKLTHQDHAGVGMIELFNPDARLASWRYTLGHNPDALRLIDESSPQTVAAPAAMH